MPRDTITLPLASQAEALSSQLAGLPADVVLRRVLSDPMIGQTALVSSFGAESVALLHLVAQVDRTTTVLFVDTQMLFPQTIAYQSEIARMLGLTDVRRIKPLVAAAAARDPNGTLHQRDVDACCSLRKTEPLRRALQPFDAWITGRKRYQADTRTTLPLVEAVEGRLKVNPLADWSAEDVRAYMDAHDLPRHPLVADGYPSIGCEPCTTRVAPGEDSRAGRWRGTEKEECGIHFVNGRVVRGPLPGREAA